MPAADREREVKFYLADPGRFEERLIAAAGRLTHPRVHEHNLRFDTPDGELGRAHCVLRLRRDTVSTLTYKGPSETEGGVRSRLEIEFTVGDFAAARRLLEVLGYQVAVSYEKYRTTYRLDPVLVTLDELPFGAFAEIEGPGGEQIRAAADRLGLDWEARVLESYMVLFDRARASLGFTFRDLTFENFRGLEVPPEALAVRPADLRA